MFRFFRDIAGGISYLRHFGVFAFLKKIPVYFRETRKTKENAEYFEAKYGLKIWKSRNEFGMISREEAKQFQKKMDPFRVAFFVHVFYLDLWEEIAGYLKQCPLDFDLFVNISDRDTDLARELSQRIQAEFLNVRIFFLPNRGRDLGSFLEMARQSDLKKYKAVCHVHTKKSPQQGKWGQIWRSELLEQVLSPKIYSVVSFLFSSQNAGLLGPKKFYYPYDNTPANNHFHYPELCDSLGIHDKSVEFFAGSMFWCAPLVLQKILDSGISQKDFEEEVGSVDGKLEHAVERIWGATSHTCERALFATEIFKSGEVRIWKSEKR